VGQGTGLGLAMVFGIVGQNHGFVHVASAPGRGATFAIYLPRHAGTAPAAPPEAVAVPLVSGHETILLVEDEPAILELTTEMLEALGYTVLAAGSPGDAIRLAGEHEGRIDLLLSDVVMPRMNGRDLARHLVSLYPHLACLFMSGYSADVVHPGVVGAGARFLEKPFSATSLAAKVREALESA
jgi:CheY-like chemotaxis protein